jgi:hypothetical protein
MSREEGSIGLGCMRRLRMCDDDRAWSREGTIKRICKMQEGAACRIGRNSFDSMKTS